MFQGCWFIGYVCTGGRRSVGNGGARVCCMEMEDQQASGLLGKRVKPDAKSDACRCGMRGGRKQQRCAADGARQSLSLAVTHPLLPVFLSHTTEPCTHCAVDAERRLGAGERTHRDPTLYMYIRHDRGRHWPAVAIIARGAGRRGRGEDKRRPLVKCWGVDWRKLPPALQLWIA